MLQRERWAIAIGGVLVASGPALGGTARTVGLVGALVLAATVAHVAATASRWPAPWLSSLQHRCRAGLVWAAAAGTATAVLLQALALVDRDPVLGLLAAPALQVASLLTCCWAVRDLVWPSATGRDPWTTTLRFGLGAWVPLLLVLSAVAGPQVGSDAAVPAAIAPVLLGLAVAPLPVLPLATRPRRDRSGVPALQR